MADFPRCAVCNQYVGSVKDPAGKPAPNHTPENSQKTCPGTGQPTK